MTKYYIYILECSNNSYYIGYTTDIARRYQEHLDGSTKCKYTRSFPPLGIAVYWELTTDLSSVLKTEKALKNLSKKQKEILISKPQLLQEKIIGELQLEVNIAKYKIG